MRNHEILKDRLETAKGIAFDGCHKVYVLMDDDQMNKMRKYGYGEDGSFLVSSEELTPKKMYALTRKWYNESCALRFIQGVQTKPDKEVWENIVGQGERFYN